MERLRSSASGAQCERTKFNIAKVNLHFEKIEFDSLFLFNILEGEEDEPEGQEPACSGGMRESRGAIAPLSRLGDLLEEATRPRAPSAWRVAAHR